MSFLSRLRTLQASIRTACASRSGTSPAGHHDGGLRRPARRLGLALACAALVLAAGLLLADTLAYRAVERQQQAQTAASAQRLAAAIDRVFQDALSAVREDAALLTQPCAQASGALREQVTHLPYLSSIQLVRRGRIACSSDGNLVPADAQILLGEAVAPHAADGSGVGAARLPGHFFGRVLFVVRGQPSADGQVLALIDSAYFSDQLAAQLGHSYASVTARIGAVSLDGAASATIGAAMPSMRSPQYVRAAQADLPALALKLQATPQSTAGLMAAVYPRLALPALLLAALTFLRVHRLGDPERRGVQRLRRALAAQAFIPYYQPLVDIRTGRCVGVEVLARWQDGDGRILAPAAFIDLAERSGLIRALTRQLMARVAHDLRTHPLPPPAGPSAGHEPLRIAINLSSRHLADPVIVTELREIFGDLLQQYRFDVEVTERAVIDDCAQARHVIELIRQLGVEVAVDDFGTDYSTLKYLQQFRFDVLKIDRSFVMGLPDDAVSLAIVAALVSLSATLGMQVIAEGVETQDQARCLHEQGVFLHQGYGYSRPLSYDALRAWLAQLCGTPSTPGASQPDSAQTSASPPVSSS